MSTADAPSIARRVRCGERHHRPVREPTKRTPPTPIARPAARVAMVNEDLPKRVTARLSFAQAAHTRIPAKAQQWRKWAKGSAAQWAQRVHHHEEKGFGA